MLNFKKKVIPCEILMGTSTHWKIHFSIITKKCLYASRFEMVLTWLRGILCCKRIYNENLNNRSRCWTCWNSCNVKCDQYMYFYVILYTDKWWLYIICQCAIFCSKSCVYCILDKYKNNVVWIVIFFDAHSGKNSGNF